MMIPRKIKWMCLVLAVATLGSPAAFAETPEPEVTSETSHQAKEAVPEASEPQPEPGNVTIDFKDADIGNVLRVLARKSGVNIVAGKDVQGLVSIRLNNVPWEKALNVVLKTYGFVYEQDGNIIRVTTSQGLKQEELATEVFGLNYARASDANGSIKDILTDRGKARADDRTNVLVVTDVPTNLYQIRKVIERLDSKTPQVLIESRVIETTLGDADRLGIDWSTKVRVAGASRPWTFPFTNMSTVGNKLAGYLPDGRGSQQTTGIAPGGTSSGGTTTIQDFPSTTPPQAGPFPVVDKNQFTFGTLDFSQFQAVMEFIKSRSDAKILSNPRITTLSNQQARILVGEILAIPKFERNSTTGVMEITGYTEKEVGIRLEVKPQVNSADEIVVHLKPEITSLLGYDEITKDIRAPRFSSRSAETEVRVKNGYTIAIGGLVRENKIDSIRKVPILGDLPILGAGFRFNDKRVDKTDLIFFITVRIVESGDQLLEVPKTPVNLRQPV